MCRRGAVVEPAAIAVAAVTRGIGVTTLRSIVRHRAGRDRSETAQGIADATPRSRLPLTAESQVVRDRARFHGGNTAPGYREVVVAADICQASALAGANNGSSRVLVPAERAVLSQ